MSTYTKTTNFTAKDNLTSGDPAKVIKGSEFDTEFNALETAVNSKADKNNGTHTGTTTIATADIDNLQIDSVAVTATAAEINTLDGITASTAELNITDGLTATTAELNTLDGITSTTAELNLLDGVTATTAELNILDGVTSTTAEINKLDGFTGTAADLNYAKDLRATGVTTAELDVLDGMTATTAELNILDGATVTTSELNILDGVTATASEINITDGLTATTAELNTLDGITATTAELNYTDGVTSNIQTQLDAKADLSGANFTGNVDVTGTVTADGLTVGDSHTIGNDSSDNLKIASSSGERVIIESNHTTVPLALDSDLGVEVKTTSGDKRFNIDGTTGDVSFYEDTGTTAKMVWDASAENVLLGETSYAKGKVTIHNGSSYPNATNSSSNAWNNTNKSHIKLTNSNNAFCLGVDDTLNSRMAWLQAGHVDSQYANATGSSELALQPFGGNVGIGTSSPNSALSVATNGGSWTTSSTDGVGINYNSGNANISTYLDTSTLQIGAGITRKNGLKIYGHTGGDRIEFQVAGSERARIDSSGRLLVGSTDNNNGLAGGTITAGDVNSTSGGVALAVRYSNGHSLANFGAMYSGGHPMLGYGVRSSTSAANTYLSTASNANFSRGVFEVDNELVFKNAGAQTTVVGSEVTMTERFRIDSSGNVGIGTSSPATKLDVEGASPTIRISDTSISSWTDNQEMGRLEFFTQDTSGNAPYDTAYIAAVNGLGGGSLPSGELVFATATYNASGGAVERMRIDDDGNVGIGTSSPSAKLDALNDIAVRYSDGNSYHGVLRNDVASGGMTVLEAKGNSSSLLFGTTDSGGTTAERARIDSSGRFMVGTSSYIGNVNDGDASGNSVSLGGVWNWFVGNSDNGSYVQYIQSSGTATHELVYFAAGTSNVGSITSNGTTTSYNTSSDERLKENIQDTTHTVDINDIRVREYDWRETGTHDRYGFIAQELETVFPEAVHTNNDEEAMKSVDYSKLVPLLVKEIQELKARIETLENN